MTVAMLFACQSACAGTICELLDDDVTSVATADQAVACGYHNLATGSSSYAAGTWIDWDRNGALTYDLDLDGDGINESSSEQNIAGALAASAIGVSNRALGDYSVAIGFRNHAEGLRSSALGVHNHANGSYSIAIGTLNWTSGANSVLTPGTENAASTPQARSVSTSASPPFMPSIPVQTHPVAASLAARLLGGKASRYYPCHDG